MWNKSNNEKVHLRTAIRFTSNHNEYGKYMNIVIFKWKNTMLNHLTNPQINHKAFIGHCAVCYKFGIPEHITRKAWKYLSKKEQYLANKQAEIAYNKWKLWYTKKSKNTLEHGKKDVIIKEYQMKFKFQ